MRVSSSVFLPTFLQLCAFTRPISSASIPCPAITVRVSKRYGEQVNDYHVDTAHIFIFLDGGLLAYDTVGLAARCEHIHTFRRADRTDNLIGLARRLHQLIDSCEKP